MWNGALNKNYFCLPSDFTFSAQTFEFSGHCVSLWIYSQFIASTGEISVFLLKHSNGSVRLKHLHVVLPKLHTLMCICRQRTRGRGRKLQSIIGHLGFGLCRSTYTWISFSVTTTVLHIPWLVEPLDLEEWATWIGRVSCET